MERDYSRVRLYQRFMDCYPERMLLRSAGVCRRYRSNG